MRGVTDPLQEGYRRQDIPYSIFGLTLNLFNLPMLWPSHDALLPPQETPSEVPLETPLDIPTGVSFYIFLRCLL
jgi:hypothetical protein